MGELTLLLQSYLEYVMRYWAELETGNFKEIRERPSRTCKKFLDEQTVTENMPELGDEEKHLLSLDTIEEFSVEM
jgi:hypothetical protein